MDYWDMIRLFPIIMNFISISAVIVSELCHKYPVELTIKSGKRYLQMRSSHQQRGNVVLSWCV